MTKSPDVNTKTTLLKAAIEVFADKGFDSATVRDICGQANANVAAINYHYGSKDGLYAAVLEEVFPAGGELQAQITPGLSPEDRLREFLRRLASDIYERGNDMMAQRWAIFLREMAKPSSNLDFIVQNHVQPMANELRDILADILGPDTPDTVLAYCSSGIWALMLDHLLIQPILDRLSPHRPAADNNLDEFVNHVLRFSLGGLRAMKG